MRHPLGWRVRAAAPAVVATLLLAPGLLADEIPFDEGWELPDRGAELRDGALELVSAEAIRRDVKLEDGTIELDMQLTGKRSFVYVQFRMEADDEYEEIYFRPHKSQLPDAVQYGPVFNGMSPWQLYHGQGYTAGVELPADAWVHVRLVLQGSRAAVYVGDGDAPGLVIPLVRRPASGYVALRGFVPPGSPAPWAARFANVKVEPGRVPADLPMPEPRPEPPAGLVRSFEVSPTFVPKEGQPIEAIPEVEGAWEELATEPSGLLLMSRYRGRPPGAREWAMLARTTLDASEPTVRRVELGYSDEISVFLNGRLLFVADDGYSPDEPRREGLIGLDQVALYLPLERGRNEVVLAVRDRFGGWGLMMRVVE